MSGRPVLLAAAIVAGGVLFATAFAVNVAEGRAPDKPRVILLGFDGVDANLTQRYIDAGALPNLAKLRQEGCFKPLDTANPAQSPVSWAVLETASNPGKTNIGDFVRRVFAPETGAPMPTL